MAAAKTLSMTLAELRGLARARRRRSARAAEVLPQLVRIVSACRTLVIEERAQGVAFRLAGETEQRAGFSLTCVLPAAQDRLRLTPAEQAVAEMLCEGLSLAQMAHQRGVSTNTIKTQVRQVFRKFNVNSRVALVRRSCP
jgi:DNA-binding NarL/FixJ family response regulator